MTFITWESHECYAFYLRIGNWYFQIIQICDETSTSGYSKEVLCSGDNLSTKMEKKKKPGIRLNLLKLFGCQKHSTTSWHQQVGPSFWERNRLNLKDYSNNNDRNHKPSSVFHEDEHKTWLSVQYLPSRGTFNNCRVANWPFQHGSLLAIACEESFKSTLSIY